MTDLPFAGKRVLVTGAGRGQGRAIALQFAHQGADLAICDIGTSRLDSLGYELSSTEELEVVAGQVRDLGRRCVARVCDVREPEQVEAFIDAAVEELGGIDIVVNNAGILPGNQPLHEVSETLWQTVLDINLTGPWRVARLTVPHLIAAGGGRIVNMASAVGLVGGPGFGAYCAAKHGVVGMTRTMAAELASRGITVNAVCPGLVDTPMVAHSASELARSENISEDEAYDAFLQVHHIKERVTPDQTAAAVLYLAGDAARTVTGVALPVDGGWTTT